MLPFVRQNAEWEDRWWNDEMNDKLNDEIIKMMRWMKGIND